jgi:hypothetical protein
VAAYPRPPVVTAPAAVRPQGAAAPFAPRGLETRDTLWGRVRRVFSGLSAPLNERS